MEKEITKTVTDNMDTLLVEFVNRMIKGMDNTVSFFEDQIPDYIYQLMLWYGIISFLAFLLSIFMLVLGVFFLRYSKKHFNWKDRWDGPSGIAVASVFSFAFSTIVFTVILIHSFAWLKILIAPKVWLVEYVQRII